MRAAIGLLAIYLLTGSAVHAGVRRFCRKSCTSAIQACVEAGTHRRPCRRAILRQCRGDARICGGTTTTSTTHPFPTTTTLYQDRVEISAADVQTFYESGSSVPAPGYEFVSVDVTIRNFGTTSVPTNAIVLRAGGLDYSTYAAYAYPPAAGVCDPYTSVAPGGELTCGLVFHVKEGATSGHLLLNAYVSPGVASDEFTISTATRPYASLSIDAVSEAAQTTYCSPRPGFKIVTFTMTVASHGASGLTLDLSRFGVIADGARYASPCGYVYPDPCDYAIGVPVDGSASCSAAFELPMDVASGTAFYSDGRYLAAAGFALE